MGIKVGIKHMDYGRTSILSGAGAFYEISLIAFFASAITSFAFVTSSVDAVPPSALFSSFCICQQVS